MKTRFIPVASEAAAMEGLAEVLIDVEYDDRIIHGRLTADEADAWAAKLTREATRARELAEELGSKGGLDV